MATHLNVPFDDGSSYLVWSPAGGWQDNVAFDQGNGGCKLTIFHDSPYANVTFTFPHPAIAFYFWGIQRSNGGFYGICFDCNPDMEGTFDTIDGLNQNGGDKSVMMYAKHFETPGIHTVRLWNLPDNRIQVSDTEKAQLAVDRFEIELTSDMAMSDMVMSTSSTTTFSTTLSPSSSMFQSAAAASTGATTGGNAPGGSNLNLGAIIGGVVGGNAALICIVVVLWFCWWKRRKDSKKRETPLYPASLNPGGDVQFVGSDVPVSPFIPSQLYTASRGSLHAEVTSSFQEDAREVDAGSLVERGIQPPIYDSLPAGASNSSASPIFAALELRGTSGSISGKRMSRLEV